jgi:hypothetical protein
MSKFLLNLLVQISKALLNSKIQFFISKRNFYQLRPNRPNRPTSQLGILAHPTHPAFFFLPVLNRAGTTTAGLTLPPHAASHPPTMEPLPQAPHRIPRLFPLPPPSIRGVKRQLRVSYFIPINAGHSFALITSRRPPRQPLNKGRAPPFSTAPLPLSSSLRTQAPPTLSVSSAISSPLSSDRLAAARAPVRPEMVSPCTPLLVVPSPAGHHAPERPLSRALSSSVAGHDGRSTMDRTLRWSLSHGLSPP